MIRNYETPEGTLSLVDSSSVTVPVKVFTSSTTGGPIAGGVTGQENAVTTIALCNTLAPDPADETTNSVTVNIYVVRNGLSYGPGNLVVSNLVVPAGETVFFSEERIVLASGDAIWVGTSAASRLSVTVSSLAV
jgi:hypothetical protein